MNDPEYILTDVFGVRDASGVLTDGILFQVQNALDLPVLNYQYGYVTELNETLQQYSKTDAFASKKFPLVWLQEPYDIVRGTPGIYGSTDNLSIYIIAGSRKDWKAADRMENNFKPIIYPIYRELLNQIIACEAIEDSNIEKLSHKVGNRYFWDKIEINDVVDGMIISQLKLKISNKQECKPFSNF